MIGYEIATMIVNLLVFTYTLKKTILSGILVFYSFRTAIVITNIQIYTVLVILRTSLRKYEIIFPSIL